MITLYHESGTPVPQNRLKQLQVYAKIIKIDKIVDTCDQNTLKKDTGPSNFKVSLQIVPQQAVRATPKGLAPLALCR